jgi:hypothetical protein
LATLPYKDKNGEDEDDEEEEEEEQEQPLYLLTCWLHPVHPIPVFS